MCGSDRKSAVPDCKAMVLGTTIAVVVQADQSRAIWNRHRILAGVLSKDVMEQDHADLPVHELPHHD